MQVLETPAVLDPIQGEPIEQLWVGWRTSEFSKVAGRCHDRFAEMMHPNAVDHGSNKQRVGRIGWGQPLGKSQSSAARREARIIVVKMFVGSLIDQNAQFPWRDFTGRLIQIPSMQELGHR